MPVHSGGYRLHLWDRGKRRGGGGISPKRRRKHRELDRRGSDRKNTDSYGLSTMLIAKNWPIFLTYISSGNLERIGCKVSYENNFPNKYDKKCEYFFL